MADSPPTLAGVLCRVGGPAVGRLLPLLDLLSHGDEQSLARSKVVDEHAVTGPYRRRQLPQAQLCDSDLHGMGDGRVEESVTGLTFGHTAAYHAVHVPPGTRRRGGMKRLHVEARSQTTAPPEVLWELLADSEGYSKWGPWSETGNETKGDP